MFSATGRRNELERLQALREPLLASPDEARHVIARAESEGFQFDD
jgi:hypothetical protein